MWGGFGNVWLINVLRIGLDVAGTIDGLHLTFGFGELARHVRVGRMPERGVDMPIDRRIAIGATLTLGTAGLALASTTAAARDRASQPISSSPAAAPAKTADLGLIPDSGRDETARLQAAIDKAAERRAPLALAAGRYIVRNLTLRAGSRLSGIPGQTIIEHVGTLPALTGAGLRNVALDGLTIHGSGALDAQARGLVDLERIVNLSLVDLTIDRSNGNGIALTGCSGVVTGCRVAQAAKAGLFSLDAAGLEISHNTITDCGNNGILVWRSAKGEDATLIAMNRIERIAAHDGGSGQNGNAINVFRAGNVIVTSNRIADCAFSAIRANSASNVQMLGNTIARMGEVALYAEFAFDGAVIGANLVDAATVGVSITNFNEGGRLATVQGNVIRNLIQRADNRDRSGVGIAVEADTAITGNVVENAPTAGLAIGWGRFCRDIVATGNIIRLSGIGIAVTGDAKAGAVLLSANIITGSTRGAIRAMDHGRPIGGDLALANDLKSRVQVSGNMVG